MDKGGGMAENKLDIWSTRSSHCCQIVAGLVSVTAVLHKEEYLTILVFEPKHFVQL